MLIQHLKMDVFIKSGSIYFKISLIVTEIVGFARTTQLHFSTNM